MVSLLKVPKKRTKNVELSSIVTPGENTRSVKGTACVERMDSQRLGVRSCVWTSSCDVGSLGKNSRKNRLRL